MAEKAGKNRKDYKQVNRGLVLKMIATGQCSTRVDLVRSTGLSKMAISNIVSELISQDLLVETEVAQSEELGRKPICLALSPKAPKVVGLVIHRNRCEAVLCGLNLEVIRKESVPMGKDMNQERLIHLAYQLLDTVLYQAENVVAIGLASIGPISAQAGKILKPFFFYGIENVEIVRYIQERYHLPVFFDHDNQSAVLAESMFGNGRGFRDVLYVGVGNGVGCGILSDGQLYCNHRGLPPELGHISIDMNGKTCACGNRGCLESYIRTPEILKKLRYHTGKYFTIDAFASLEGDENVERVFVDMVMKMASAIISVVNMLNSELILLGNDSVFLADKYIRLLEEQVNERRFVEWEQPVLVKRAYFMQDAAMMGAACNAIAPIFAGKLLFEV